MCPCSRKERIGLADDMGSEEPCHMKFATHEAVRRSRAWKAFPEGGCGLTGSPLRAQSHSKLAPANGIRIESSSMQFSSESINANQENGFAQESNQIDQEQSTSRVKPVKLHRLQTQFLLGVLAAALLQGLPGAECSTTAIFIVPVYEWTNIWKEWRNDDYAYGSIWRPTMIDQFDRNSFPGKRNAEVDEYDLRQYMSRAAEVVHLGDVFVKGHEKPSFVGTVIVIDTDSVGCPGLSEGLGISCFERPAGAEWQGLLFITPDKNRFEKVWNSHIKQCVEQTAENIPLLCTPEEEGKGQCDVESGFGAGVVPVSIFRPSCPSDFYVMGHIAIPEANGTHPRSPFMPQYKCLHESLLRTTTFESTPLFTGAQPGTSVWNPTQISEEYAEEISLWSPNCKPEICKQDRANRYCVDAISQGLFYASNMETTANNQITGPRISAPSTGPKCLTAYRDCTQKQLDGLYVSNTGADWDGQSNCDYELGKDSNGIPLGGLRDVNPSGIPTPRNYPENPPGPAPMVELTLTVDGIICDTIAPPGQDDNVGEVRINGIGSVWKSMDNTLSTSCTIKVDVLLNGQLRAGPARIDIRTVDDALQSGPIEVEGKNVGTSFGRLYIYHDPSKESELIEPIVVNTDDCALFVLIKLPPYTQMLWFGEGGYRCEFRTGNETSWREASNPRGIQKDYLGYRAIQCGIPQKTEQHVVLRMTMNGAKNWHVIQKALVRLGTPRSIIPSDKALRLYDVTPRTGPQEGGTKLTLFGEFFSTYCKQPPGYCNQLQCNFVCGPSEVLVSVNAEFISDTVLTCVTPKALVEVENCTVQTAVDVNGPCSSVDDDIHSYNKIPFLYQTDLTRAAVPPAEECCNDDPKATPHRVEGEWDKCRANWTDPVGINCSGLPGVSDVAAGLGYFSCLGGFKTRDGRNTTGIDYPVWCIRALPMNSAKHYAFTVFDPFFKVTGFALRKVPLNYPGRCHRTNHHVPWVRWTEPIDYRLFDVTDRTYFRGRNLPNAAKVTQGRNLIDRLWSSTALDLTIPYMRDVMHRIGEEYGFLDLRLAFSIQMDFTIASGYGSHQHRRQIKCAKPNPKHGNFSGDKGDIGPGGNYHDWFQQDWERGQPACSLDERWEEGCSNTILRSPNKEDDTGVMITKPAKVEITEMNEDYAVGCGRLRVSFNCSKFNLEDCIRHEVQTYNPSSQYRNVGAKTQYKSYVGWCDFMYPDLAGPNNPNGWDDPGGSESSKDWRYFARTSPCVRCRQAQEICNALAVDPARLPIEDNIPKGTIPSNLGDLNIAAEIRLGCFGPDQFGGAVEDQCCDDVLDMDTNSVGVPGICVRTLERCVRPGKNFMCARRNLDDLEDMDCGYNLMTKEVPMCVPKGLV
mmetsp:Transcript_19225/g.39212  ORF Transcript_19225/g.39212 Transcript_19225/m.39212 type:complete len:1366 (-) Transcript_19225:114-4211(-)|eukprot:CAMPEP_0181303328 /NCGR_PEP_ID=MMETSP1101-20121128/8495_1 /TAXON_ID=46948 /ORGANISM="Rhodomonas abbreviata, Strain Caron Lab Isolate" /LENGTH=1365 /DNA_ID=CAMNT_0023408885 /DNA_START=214 /DNA_END=4311 /DNA_ORIENTATION=+